eukprot:CAMPEP_0185843902 /NCGR_PEP_ID=MMETSP1354-20130828/266_1 /TAXON_ID=708628 /ORGANISM="Erythrolobus madagascarensis, Strain CCMP3276" /LENGTH=391 /DNA_ID=CAMNT_0028543485 /DNA_START=178 /DNA_END=1353 /DNA_ORIENTATION=-
MSASGGVWTVWTALICSAGGGLVAEKTKVGATLSAPLCAMFATLVMTNVGLLPPQHVVYDVINAFLVPMAVPLLLFAADIRTVLRDTGVLLRAFVIGAIGTLVGTLVAAKCVPLRALGDDAWKVAAMLCARHIGGAVNYVAVADALGASGSATTAALAADNLVVAGYFMTLFALSSGVRDPGSGTTPKNRTDASSTASIIASTDDSGASESVSVDANDLALVLGISGAVCCVASMLATKLAFLSSLGMIPVSTLIVLVLVTLAPAYFGRLAPAANAVGVLFMQLFFAAAGASGSIAAVFRSAPALFGFITLQLAVHLGIVLTGGALLRLPRAALLTASNANVGGPTTAAGFASSKSWTSLIIPALLVGILGYAIATFLSVLLARLVLIRLM